MRLLRDERAYRLILDDFVDGRLDVAGFLSRFYHLWQCDGAPAIDSALATGGATHEQSALYGVLDEVEALCRAYSCALPEGCGYRVSEEQFRKEIQSLTCAIRLRACPVQERQD